MAASYISSSSFSIHREASRAYPAIYKFLRITSTRADVPSRMVQQVASFRQVPEPDRFAHWLVASLQIQERLPLSVG
jgi:hypothetical protein